MAYGYNSLGNLATDAWVQTQTGGRFQYITTQGLAMAWLTMVFSLIADLFPSSILIYRVKRVLSMTALPLAIAVSSMYWTLFFILPRLPSSSPYSIPIHIDLCLHLVPALALVADFVLLQEKLSENEAWYGAPIVVILFTIWYGSWVEYCAGFNGSFPYPYLTNNPLKKRIGTYIGVANFALVSFWIINSLRSKKFLLAK